MISVITSSITRPDLKKQDFSTVEVTGQQQIATGEDFDWREFNSPMVALMAAMIEIETK